MVMPGDGFRTWLTAPEVTMDAVEDCQRKLLRIFISKEE